MAVRGKYGCVGGQWENKQNQERKNVWHQWPGEGKMPKCWWSEGGKKLPDVRSQWSVGEKNAPVVFSKEHWCSVEGEGGHWYPVEWEGGHWYSVEGERGIDALKR